MNQKIEGKTPFSWKNLALIRQNIIGRCVSFDGDTYPVMISYASITSIDEIRPDIRSNAQLSVWIQIEGGSPICATIADFHNNMEDFKVSSKSFESGIAEAYRESLSTIKDQ